MLWIDNWEQIRDELIEVLKEAEAIPKFHEIDKIQKFISATDDIPWRTFGIKAFDQWIEPNASMVPFTRSILELMPSVTLAMFSILDAGKHIPRHFGFFKGVLRYHLALVVPEEGECYIVCGKKRYDWKEGESKMPVGSTAWTTLKLLFKRRLAGYLTAYILSSQQLLISGRLGVSFQNDRSHL